MNLTSCQLFVRGFVKMGCEGERILRLKIPKIDRAETLKSTEQNSLTPK